MKLLRFFFALSILLFSFTFSINGMESNNIFPIAHAQEDPKPAESHKYDDITLREPLPGIEEGKITLADKDAVGVLETYIGPVFLFGLAIGSIFAVLMIIVGGYEYMSAGGDSGKTDNAKGRIMQALLGLTMLFGGALFLNFINPNFFLLS